MAMASKEQEFSELEEETNALRKKKWKRVSFADKTDIFEFEDYESPDSRRSGDASGSPVEALPLFRGCSDNDDSKEEADDEEDDNHDDAIVGRKSFLHPIASPSPRSSACSPNSNDEDNIFGPVSASFIRPRRLSDSATSDENYDVTMDSTAFSMHFRSFARPDNDDINGIPSDFIEKTPNNGSASTGFGSSMVLTGAKKPTLEPILPVDRASDGDDSNVMSLVKESQRKYYFGKISSGLDSLLAEGRKDLDPVTVSSHADASKSTKVMAESSSNANKHDKITARNEQQMEPAKIISSHSYVVRGPSAVSEVSPSYVRSPPGVSKARPMNLTTVSSPDKNASKVIDQQITTPKLPIKAIEFEGSQKSINYVLERSRLRLMSAINSRTEHYIGSNISPLKSGGHASRGSVKGNSLDRDGAIGVNLDQDETGAPSYAGFISSSTGKRLRVDSEIVLFSSPALDTTSTERLFFSVEKEKRSDPKISFDSSISSFKLFELSPKISNVKGASTHLQLRSPNDSECKGNNQHQQRLHNLPNERQFRSIGLIDQGQDMVAKSNDHLENHEKFGLLSQVEESRNCHEVGNLMTLRSVDQSFAFVSNHPTPLVYSSSTGSRKDAAGDLLRIQNPSHENFAMPMGDVSVAETLACAKSSGDRNCFVSSPVRKKLSISPNSESRLLENSVKNSDSTKGSENLVAKDCFVSYPMEEAPENSKNVAASPLLQPSTAKGEVNNVLGGLEAKFARWDVISNSGCKRSKKEAISPKDISENYESSRSSMLNYGLHDLNLSEPFPTRSRIASENVEYNCTSKSWSEVVMEISRRSQLLHLSLINRLNDLGIDDLEGIIGHLQIARTFESLNSQVQSQKNAGLHMEVKYKWVSQARLILCNMMYERAKLQVLLLRRDRLLRRVELLSAKKHESRTLKACFTKAPDIKAGHFRMNDCDSQFGSVLLGKNKHSVETVNEMKRELDVTDREIEKFTRLFHGSRKMKEDLVTADEVVSTFSTHVKEILRSRFILNDLQFWAVDDVESVKRQHVIVLRYLNFMFQSLKVESGLVSNMIVSNKLNMVTIMKKFPNMDAAVAFFFVFNATGMRKNVKHGSLARETQNTSLLLSSLVDVAEEVQFAQVELRNLVRATFHAPSAGQLHLDIRFVNFKTRETVSSTLDVTCLRQGVYPYDIVPSRMELTISAAGTMPQHPTRPGEVEVAIGNIRCGYSRIIRLCRCISRAVEASR